MSHDVDDDALVFVGEVITGNRIGRTIGFRTANVAAPQAERDRYGIYTTTVILEDGRSFGAVSNLGVKPTIGSEHPLLEVHIFDFEEDLYGTRIEATLHHRLREERRFPSLEALKAQLALDREAARRRLAARM